ncbi:MAG: lytic transglycosylase domain-containing protein [Luteimonas sp.]
MNCQALAVPAAVMRHVVDVESAFNPYAIGVVGARLARQPRTLPEAIATARMLADRGYNFSLGLGQVNRYNLARYGLSTYALAFDPCANLRAGSRILAECYGRSGSDWGKAFSCYYSGNFTTGFRDGYVQKVFASMRSTGAPESVKPASSIPIAAGTLTAQAGMQSSLLQRRTSIDRHEQGAATALKGEPEPTASGAASTPSQGERTAIVDSRSVVAAEAGVATQPRDTAFVF